MNIDKIVKEYSRAWAECSKFLRFDGFELKGFVNNNFVIKVKDREIRERVFYRELFDYFDSVGVYVKIDSYFNGKYWSYNIGNYLKKNGYSNRTEAEYKAFERAFEIRQQQIEGK